MEQITLIICITVFASIIAISMTVIRCVETICNKEKPIVKEVVKKPSLEPYLYKCEYKEYVPKEAD